MAKKESFDSPVIPAKAGIHAIGKEPDFSALEEPRGFGGGFKEKVREKLSAFYSKLFSIVKFILGVAFLPFVFSTTVSFMHQLTLIDKNLEQLFWKGVVSFLVVYLFVWEPAAIYNRGYKLLEFVFNFFKPLVKVAPFLLPIYTIIVFSLYGIASLMVDESVALQYMVFFTGFTLALHLVFCAKSIRGRKGDFLKGNYIFGFSFIYIINLALVAFGFNIIFKNFSFVDFCNIAYSLASNLFHAAFKQLFSV